MKKTTPKLGKRLQQLHDMVLPDVSHYNHIWDCCCDHGLLGMALLESTSANIHFVDIVPHIMAELEETLKANYSNTTWQTHCLNVTKLPLTHYPNNSHLVIIAGVGGDLAAELITAILDKHPSARIEFLLCPVHRIYTLRQQLIQLDLRLKNEVLIKENKRFYEAIWVTNQENHGEAINPIGSMLWDSQTPEQATTANAYLQQILTHYHKVALGYQTQTENETYSHETQLPIEHIIGLYESVIIPQQ